MGVVQVDPVGTQPLQTFIAFTLDLGRAETTLASRIVEGQLGGDDHPVPVAALLHPRADGAFALPTHAAGQPARIHVGGVNERAAIFTVKIKQLERRVAIDLAPDQVAAHGQRTHFQIGLLQFYLFHDYASALT
jgi:hypothetical protein